MDISENISNSILSGANHRIHGLCLGSNTQGYNFCDKRLHPVHAWLGEFLHQGAIFKVDSNVAFVNAMQSRDDTSEPQEKASQANDDSRDQTGDA